MKIGLWLSSAFLMLLGAAPSQAGVYHSRESALALAFPDADEILPVDLLLTREEAARTEARAGVSLPSRLVTVYEGRAGNETLGWAFFDTHDVRSLPETILLVVGPNGRVQGTHLLAFHEPKEYEASARWFGQFDDRRLSEDLSLGNGIAGIAGSTLTSRAVTATVRRLLAVWHEKLDRQIVSADVP